MSGDAEQSLLLRRFEGTNLLVDGAFLGPAYLRRSQNWIPGETFRLEKRQGTTAYLGGIIPDAVTRVAALLAHQTRDGTRFLFAVASRGDLPADVLYASQAGGPFIPVTGGQFLAFEARYAMEVVDDILYVGNATENILRVELPSLTAVFMFPVAAFTDGSADATVTDDPGAQILSGTYAYSWCIFDHTNEVYVERGQTREVTKKAAGDQHLSFPTPTGMANALDAQFKAHLFVSPVNYPVEFGHDQTPQGVDEIDLVGPIV